MSTTLSEADSAKLLADFGVPIAASVVTASGSDAARAATEMGFPVVAKLCGDQIAHKTERGLVRLGLTTAAQVDAAATELLAAATPDDGEVGVLVAPVIAGARELIAGISNDPQFGHTVMLGVGGVLTEVVADVAIRVVPLTEVDAHEMIDELRLVGLFDDVRGEGEIDRTAVAEVLIALSNAAQQRPDIQSADCNPMIVCNGKPIAVDALVEVAS